MEKSFGGLVFRSILIFFSCVLLVFSMLSTVRLAEMNDRLMETEKRIEELSVKNDVLLAQYESSMGLDEIEKYATNLEDILNSTKFIEFNNLIKKGIMPSNLCQKCDFKRRL